MYKTFILVFAIIHCNQLFSQNITFAKLPSQHIQLHIGRSFNGTGDMRGFVFTTHYGKYFKKRLEWSASLTGTIHDGSNYLMYTDPGGKLIDGSIRYTTAGAQLSGQLGYAALRNVQHELMLKGGPLLRFQSSSYYDIYEILMPAITNLNYPVIAFNHRTPQRTVSAGFNLQLHYNYTFNNKILLGILAGLQTDTEGDTISQLSISVGKRFF